MEKALFQENSTEKKPYREILGSIMTAAEYAEMQHERPYTFVLKNGDKELHYFGSSHECDPEDPLFAEIKTAFDQSNADIVFVEGMSVHGDRERFNARIKTIPSNEIIIRMGESGFTLKLALEKGIEWYCPEPSSGDLYQNLLSEGYSKDEIFAWDVFHILPQYYRQMNQQGFKQYVEPFIEWFREVTNWKDFDYSYERAITLGEEILNRSIDIENEPDASSFIDPIPWVEKREAQTVLNRINASTSLFRDRKIVSDILDAFKEHNRVFIVYGASHAVMQEPALRKFFESNEVESE